VLNDPTGSRRFWVIPTAPRINIELLKEHLEQIWAQAYTYFEEETPHYLSDEMEALRAQQSGRHQMENRFADLTPQIMVFYTSVPRPNGITLNDIFTFLDGKVGEGQDGKTGERKGFAKPTNAERRELGACLRAAGWSVKQGFVYGASAKCFRPPEKMLLQLPKTELPPPGQASPPMEDDDSNFKGLAQGELI